MWTGLADAAHLVASDLPGFGHPERRDDLLSPRAMGEVVADASHPTRFRSMVVAIGTIAPAYQMPQSIRDDYLNAYLGDRFLESMRYVRAYPTELPILGELLPTIDTPVQTISGSRDRVIPSSNSRFLLERLPHSKMDILDAGHFVWEEQPAAYASLLTSCSPRWAYGCSTRLRWTRLSFQRTTNRLLPQRRTFQANDGYAEASIAQISETSTDGRCIGVPQADSASPAGFPRHARSDRHTFRTPRTNARSKRACGVERCRRTSSLFQPRSPVASEYDNQ
jgi:hypothetical protein